MCLCSCLCLCLCLILCVCVCVFAFEFEFEFVFEFVFVFVFVFEFSADTNAVRCRSGNVSVNIVGTGVSGGAASGIGTPGASCFTAANWADTGLQQASFELGCVDSAPCLAKYDLRTSCSPVIPPPSTTTTAAPTSTTRAPTTVAATTTTTAPGGTQLVCFQPYNNATCAMALGTAQCSLENRCTHTDTTAGVDESTLQVCHGDYVTISLYRNSSSCRPDALFYAFNVSTNGCQGIGGYPGILTCGKKCVKPILSNYCLKLPLMRRPTVKLAL